MGIEMPLERRLLPRNKLIEIPPKMNEILQLKFLAEDCDRRFAKIGRKFEYIFEPGLRLPPRHLKRIKKRIENLEATRVAVVATLRLQTLPKTQREKFGIRELSSSEIRELKRDLDSLGKSILGLTEDYRHGKKPMENLPGDKAEAA